MSYRFHVHPLRGSFARSFATGAPRPGPPPRPPGKGPSGTPMANAEAQESTKKAAPKTAAQARREDLKQRLREEGAIDIDVPPQPMTKADMRPKAVRRAQGRQQTNPEGMTSEGIVSEVMRNPMRVRDPELTQFLPDIHAMLVATDVKLRQTVLQTDDPSTDLSLLYCLITLGNLIREEEMQAKYFSSRGVAALVVNCLSRQPSPAPLKVRLDSALPALPMGYALPLRIAALSLLKDISHLPENDRHFESQVWINYLARSIRSPEDEERELSIFLLTNASAIGLRSRCVDITLEANQAFATSAGCLETLMSILRADSTDQMASTALSNILAAPEAPSVAQKSGVVAMMMSYLTPVTKLELVINAVISLGHLARNEKCREDLRQQGFLARILQLLDLPNVTVQEYATWAIETSKEMMWQSQALNALVDAVDFEDAVVRRNATQALTLALRDCPSNQKALVDIDGAIEALQAAIQDPEELVETKSYAVLALGSIISNGELFSFVEKSDLLRWLLSVLIVSPAPLQSSILLAFGMGCTSYKVAVELVAVDVSKVVLRLASRKFGTDAELAKRLKEEEEDAKADGRVPTTQLIPNAEVANAALSLLERIDLVLRTNSGVGVEDTSAPEPVTD